MGGPILRGNAQQCSIKQTISVILRDPAPFCPNVSDEATAVGRGSSLTSQSGAGPNNGSCSSYQAPSIRLGLPSEDRYAAKSKSSPHVSAPFSSRSMLSSFGNSSATAYRSEAVLLRCVQAAAKNGLRLRTGTSQPRPHTQCGQFPLVLARRGGLATDAHCPALHREGAFAQNQLGHPRYILGISLRNLGSPVTFSPPAEPVTVLLA